MIRSTVTTPHRSSSPSTSRYYKPHSLSSQPHILISDHDRDDHSIHSDDTVQSIKSNQPQHILKEHKLIQCGACFRSFHTQAQFGQHSRICREGKAVIRHLIQSTDYKYAFLEKQTKQKLEVKSRFVIEIADSENWKKLSRQSGLYDGAIKKMLQSKDIKDVDVAVRQRRASGLIIANFMVRNVSQNAKAIHTAKSSIERAVDNVYCQLPHNIAMRLHLCKSHQCQELVIRDTEGFCSRHRAQKYHKKNQNHKVYNKCQMKEENEQQKRTKNKAKVVAVCVPPQTQTEPSKNVCNNYNGSYNDLLNHLKATAPKKSPSPPTITEERSTTMTEDDEIVAQILANLRATCASANRKRTLEDIAPPPPHKKRKLMTSNAAAPPVYMVPIYGSPIYPISIPMQPVPSMSYGLVPMNNVSSTNVWNKLIVPPLPPIASFCNAQTEDRNE
eukprot:97364_1